MAAAISQVTVGAGDNITRGLLPMLMSLIGAASPQELRRIGASRSTTTSSPRNSEVQRALAAKSWTLFHLVMGCLLRDLYLFFVLFLLAATVFLLIDFRIDFWAAFLANLDFLTGLLRFNFRLAAAVFDTRALTPAECLLAADRSARPASAGVISSTVQVIAVAKAIRSAFPFIPLTAS